MKHRNDDHLNDSQKKFMSTFGKMGNNQHLADNHKKVFFQQMDSMMKNGKFTPFFKNKFSLSKVLQSFFKEKNAQKSDDDSNWFNS